MKEKSENGSGGRKWEFRPGLAIATALVVSATVGLALWQFDRAAQKRALESAARSGMSAAAITLRAGDGVVPVRFQRVAVSGRFVPEGEVLIDNRVRARRPGYDVVSPLRMDDGKVVAVNRGWIPARLDRTIPDIPPSPSERTTVHGVFIPDQSDALELSAWTGWTEWIRGNDTGTESAETESGKVRQNLKLRDFARESNLDLRTTLVLALQSTPRRSGVAFRRSGVEPPTGTIHPRNKNAVAAESEPVATSGMLLPEVRVDFRSARSDAYALQWLTFAALAIIFFLALSRKRNNNPRPPAEAEEQKENPFRRKPEPIDSASSDNPSPRKHRNNRPLALIILIAVATPALSTWMYFNWRPASFSHYGELLSPPIPIPTDWREESAAFPAADEWRGNWVLLFASDSACGDECRQRLCQMRQLRLMMRADQTRIRRAWLITNDAPSPKALTTTSDCAAPRAAALRARAKEVDILTNVHLVRPPAPAGPIGTTASQPQLQPLMPNRIHIADPNGMLIMRYPSDADPYQIRRDLRRLLKLSQRPGGN